MAIPRRRFSTHFWPGDIGGVYLFPIFLWVLHGFTRFYILDVSRGKYHTASSARCLEFTAAISGRCPVPGACSSWNQFGHGFWCSQGRVFECLGLRNNLSQCLQAWEREVLLIDTESTKRTALNAIFSINSTNSSHVFHVFSIKTPLERNEATNVLWHWDCSEVREQQLEQEREEALRRAEWNPANMSKITHFWRIFSINVKHVHINSVIIFNI
jgi:hypothetical protein